MRTTGLFRTSGERWKTRGFTLIELLIVIAIILILISIALPNFLEATERARVVRAAGHLRTMETAIYSHKTDYGYLYSDYNDDSPMTQLTRNKSLSRTIPCPANEPAWRGSGGLVFGADNATHVGASSNFFQQQFYANGVHCPLTSPIPYIGSEGVVDPWSDGSIPVGMDSRCFNCAGSDDFERIVYSAYFVSGPDRYNGDWTIRLPYNPTNGTRSFGDLWFIIANNTTTAKNEYRGILKTY